MKSTVPPMLVTFLIAWGGFCARESFAHRDSTSLTIMWAVSSVGLLAGGVREVRRLAARQGNPGADARD